MRDAQTAVHVRIGNFSIRTCTDVEKFRFEKIEKNRKLKTYPIRDAQTAVHVRIGNFSIGTCTDVEKFRLPL
jgi:hypothetical protein